DAPAAEASATEEGSPVLISVIGGDHDVEAPEIFKVTDKGLWDGRPSLGGVWVAHSSVKDPQRVVIRNPANGKSVNGALFRREIDNPGPSLQLSSDAAQALGLLAGQPSTLEVVAIKRVEAPARAPEPEAAPVVAAAPVAAAATQATISAEASAPADSAGAETAAPKLTKAQERKAKREARKQERAAAKAALAAAAAETARLAAPATSSRPKKKPGSEGTASAESTIVQKPLEEVVSTAEAAISKAAGQATQADAAAPAAAPAAAEAEAAAAAPKASEKLNRPFVQIAVFNVEANAEKAAADMRKAGLIAAVKKGSQDGNAFWRVVVGPAASVADRDAMTTRLKTLGYPDAYPVKN
ncbi:MAG: SPOR domain-containing protein, partial [Albidovulum sp.]